MCVWHFCSKKYKGNWTQICLGLKGFQPSRLMQPAAILKNWQYIRDLPNVYLNHSTSYLKAFHKSLQANAGVALWWGYNHVLIIQQVTYCQCCMVWDICSALRSMRRTRMILQLYNSKNFSSQWFSLQGDPSFYFYRFRQCLCLICNCVIILLI